MLILKRKGAININKVLVAVVVVAVVVVGLMALKNYRHNQAALQYSTQTGQSYASPAMTESSPATSSSDIDSEVNSMENSLNAVPPVDTSDPSQ